MRDSLDWLRHQRLHVVGELDRHGLHDRLQHGDALLGTLLNRLQVVSNCSLKIGLQRSHSLLRATDIGNLLDQLGNVSLQRRYHVHWFLWCLWSADWKPFAAKADEQTLSRNEELSAIFA